VFADALLFAAFGSAGEEDYTVTVVVSTVPSGATSHWSRTLAESDPGAIEAAVQR